MDFNNLTKEEKIEKLILDVRNKKNTFGLHTTLFNLVEISDQELNIFFETNLDNIQEILPVPNGVMRVDGELKSFSTHTIRISDLKQPILIDRYYSIAFYDITKMDDTTYHVRFHKYEDELKRKQIGREKKIDDLLK